MMYDMTSPSGFESTTWAKDKLDELSKKYPEEKDFWDYMQKQWQPKAHMWVVGYRNLPYAGQDKNILRNPLRHYLDGFSDFSGREYLDVSPQFLYGID